MKPPGPRGAPLWSEFEPDESLPPDWFRLRVGNVTPCWLRQSRYACCAPLDDEGAADDALDADATLPLDPEQAAAPSAPMMTNVMIPARE